MCIYSIYTVLYVVILICIEKDEGRFIISGETRGYILIMKLWKLLQVILINFVMVLIFVLMIIHKKDVKPSAKPKKPLTIQCNRGRLGNQMCSYATLYGVARHNNRIPQVLMCNMKHLIPFFEVTVKAIDQLPLSDYSEYKLSDSLREQDRQIPDNNTILTGYLYPESYTFYHEFKEEIRKQFRFKPTIKQYAEKTLLNIRKNHKYNAYIGMHIRRTDYCMFLRKYRGRVFDTKYLEEAVAYFRQKYQPALFVVVSDDKNWCLKALSNFEDVVLSPKPPSAAHDLALLASCNHSIITYGTFGYWGAYLAGGDTVYFTDYLSPDSGLLKRSPNALSRNPPEWLGISTTPEGFWLNYSLPKC